MTTTDPKKPTGPAGQTPPPAPASAKQATTEKKQGKRRGVVILLIISVAINALLISGGGYTVIKYDNQVDSLVDVSVDLKTELNQTATDLDKYRGISDELDKMLASANLELDTTRAKIEQMIANGVKDKSMIDQLRHELRRIKRKRARYEEEIDQLLLENRELKSKNLDLAVTVGNLEEEKEELVKKVDVASRMSVEYANIIGWRGKGKSYKETALAKKVERFNVCFDVMENKVTNPGNKVVYLRMTGPAGEILGNEELGSGKFVDTETQKEKLFTIQKNIDYRNERQNFCVEWEDPGKEDYEPGTYTVEFYVDGTKAGVTSFVLR
ncbi:MAG: hypothetical protein KDD36_03240 [Flavobacteriales bacterium]|nr:hypothetical protein [Flavobacteriales bacterium]